MRPRNRNMKGARGACVVLVTCPTKRIAQRIATTLVDKRLAACVNILPDIRSIFRWEGKVDRATEILLVIKTTARRFESLRRAIRRLHPYQVPEIIALSITKAHPPYLAWIARSVRLP